MAASEADVCNRALGRIGQTKSRLTSLEDGKGATANACRDFYADSRDAALEAFGWPFAMRRAQLAALSNVTRDGWAFAYTLPADCIATRYLFNASQAGSAAGIDPDRVGDAVLSGDLLPLDIPFAIEDDETLGRLLLTDEDVAQLLYTARVTQVPRFSPLFVDALAWLLASDLALALTKSASKAERMLLKYEQALARAAASAGNQMKRRPRRMSRFERGR